MKGYIIEYWKLNFDMSLLQNHRSMKNLNLIFLVRFQIKLVFSQY